MLWLKPLSFSQLRPMAQNDEFSNLILGILHTIQPKTCSCLLVPKWTTEYHSMPQYPVMCFWGNPGVSPYRTPIAMCVWRRWPAWVRHIRWFFPGETRGKQSYEIILGGIYISSGWKSWCKNCWCFLKEENNRDKQYAFKMLILLDRLVVLRCDRWRTWFLRFGFARDTYGVLGLWRTQSYCWWKKSG